MLPSPDSFQSVDDIRHCIFPVEIGLELIEKIRAEKLDPKMGR
jgi:hypothetical protein